MRLHQRHAVHAFERWREQTTDLKSMNAKAMKAARQLKKNVVVETLDLWRDCVVEDRKLKAKARKVVQRLINRALLEGFDSWRDRVFEESHRKATARSEEQRYKAMMQRVVKRMQHSTLALWLLRWREQVWELRWQQGILKNMASRIRNAAVCKAVARWGESAKEVHRHRTEEMQKWGGERKQTLQKILGRMLHRSLSQAIDLWQENVHALQQEQAEEERRQNIMSLIVRRMLNQGKAAAFHRWSANVRELARQCGIMDRILSRMINAKQAVGETARVLAASHCAPWAFSRAC